jgi:class 3 adenylate cyclase/predicted ATPase
MECRANQGAVMDVGGWLRKLGLGHYEAAFRENKIDDTVLPSLTAEDLKDLGVGFVGDRRKLLDAIAALRPDASAPMRLLSDAPLVTDKARDAAERRQVTVMFSDLVGSTALSTRMDPEDLREVITAYQKCVAETVRRFGGFVAKFMGDGVLVYFGYPEAHEDDADRAVRAGLELIAAVTALNAAALQTRVGIATGLVIVGDLVGSGEAQERGIVGETPNLAARLQAVADPNMVILAESTRKLLGNLFELKDLGAKELKGISGHARAWAALRPASVEGRFEAMHASGLTELVGREEELDLLLRRWSKAKSGEGQVVLLSGEAGIGKSRLTAALLERLATEPHTRLRYFCSPQYTDSAFYPIVGQMERAAGLAYDDTAQAKLDKLDTLLAQSSTPREDAALFAEMLSLPNDGRYPTLELIPQQRRQRTFEALTAQIEALARRSPVLMIFEDAHWADPTTLEAFGRAVDRIRALGVLLIITYRPEFEAPWTGQPHVTALTLNRLGQREISTMIDRVTGNKPLLATIRQDIVERTDGIPLFIEEVTKAVLEAGGQQEAERAVTSIPVPSLAVPASLHASLMARLDRLGAAKEVAQVGAAIGRDFSHALLAAVAPKSEAELNFELDRIIAAGLLFRQGNPPFATYLFKHALVQEAAYGTLLREPRRALHAHIAETIENEFAETAERQPELLAHHYTEAGVIERGALLWGKAGQRALERSAFAEAVGQLRRALDQIATLPATPVLRREQINFQVALSNSLFNVKGFGPETKAALEQASLLIEQAVALGEPPEDPLLLFVVLYSSWYANVMMVNTDVCRDLAERTLALAEKQNALVPLIVGHHIMAGTLGLVGAPAQGLKHCDQALALYDPVEHRSMAMRFGVDLRVAILHQRSSILGALGYSAAANADAEGALSSARATGHASTLLLALVALEKFYLFSGNYTAANAALNELEALADEKGASAYKTAVNTGRGRLAAFTGRPAEAVQVLTSGLADAAQRSTGKTLYLPLNLSCIARAHAELGQFDEARRRIDEAKTALEATGEKWCEALVYITAGEIALKSPEPDAAKAEAYFERALIVARQQQAKSWELVAATNMARLWRDQGKPQQAHELLSPVYGWFTEGFDTRALKEAKALLDELAR